MLPKARGQWVWFLTIFPEDCAYSSIKDARQARGVNDRDRRAKVPLSLVERVEARKTQ